MKKSKEYKGRGTERVEEVEEEEEVLNIGSSLEFGSRDVTAAGHRVGAAGVCVCV